MRKILWLLWFFSSHQRFHSIHNLATIFLGIFLNRPIARVPRWKRLTIGTASPRKCLQKNRKPPNSSFVSCFRDFCEKYGNLRKPGAFIFLRHFLIYLRVSAFQLTNIFKEFPNIFKGFPNIFVEFRQNCWGVSVDFETLFTIFFWGVCAKFLRRSDISKSLTVGVSFFWGN